MGFEKEANEYYLSYGVQYNTYVWYVEARSQAARDGRTKSGSVHFFCGGYVGFPTYADMYVRTWLVKAARQYGSTGICTVTLNWR